MNDYLKVHETDRLTIRPLNVGDVENWKSFLSNEEATKHFPSTMSNPNFAQTWIQGQLDRYDNGAYGLMALEDKETGQFIGQCGLLKQTIDDTEEIEIGYHIMPEFWAKGYATEAARHFKNYAFNNNISRSIVSIIHPDNVGSQMVASKNGMAKEKTTIYRDMKAFVFRIDH